MVHNSFTDDDLTLRMLREVFPGVEIVTPERPAAWDLEEVRRSVEFCRSPAGVAAMERDRSTRERRLRVDAAMREDGVPAWRRPHERAAYERLDARLQHLRARRDDR